MIMHIQYHEDPLLEHLADNVPSRPVRRDVDPLNAFLRTLTVEPKLPACTKGKRRIITFLPFLVGLIIRQQIVATHM